MSLVIRKIRWDSWAEADPGEGDDHKSLPADPVSDLRTTGNALSVYFVDKNNPEQLERVLAAIAAGSQSLALIDFALFDEEVLKTLRLKYVRRPGSTFDSVVNDWHADIVDLTAADLLALASALIKEDRDRRLENEVGTMIAKGLQAGHIDQTRVQDTVISKLVKKRFLQFATGAPAKS